MKKLNCILLVDDNEDDNYFHTLTIQELNAAEQIKTAINGVKALEYLEKGKEDPQNFPIPDLIFLDINMPGINGFEFLEKAKQRKLIHEGVPAVVVMLTSSLNPNDEKKAKEQFSSEIKDFQNKPLTVEMLKKIIEKFFPELIC